MAAASPFRPLMAGGLTAFCYHDVTDTPSAFARRHGLAMSPERFRRQIAWIRSNFDVVHPSDLREPSRLPRHPALLTFDDGFAGSFANGVAHLAREGVPSVMFLNMRTVTDRVPMLSAIACYLDEHDPRFAAFARDVALPAPVHLTLTPVLLAEFERRHGAVDTAAVWKYQGDLATLAEIDGWDVGGRVTFGNHLFQHWNAAALTPAELTEQFVLNRAALTRFRHRVDAVAFPNGQPHTCFRAESLATLRSLGAEHAFAASGRLSRNPAAFLLDRVSMSAGDDRTDRLWFRIAKSLLAGPMFPEYTS